jgi:hypothetical protein
MITVANFQERARVTVCAERVALQPPLKARITPRLQKSYDLARRRRSAACAGWAAAHNQ